MSELNALVDGIIKAGSLPLNRALGIPMGAYNSPALYDLEIEHIFRPNWINIGRADLVSKPNSFMSIDVAGEPLVMTRDAQGEVHVFSRLCPHRGMEITEGSGETKTFVCPYHIWSFDLAGRCKHAPYMEGNESFSPEASGLRKIRFENWNGFIFVNLDGKAAPLAPQLQPLDDMLADYHLADLVTAHTQEWGEMDIDWKMMLENSVECYHHIGTHAKSIQSTYPAELSWTEPSNGIYSVTYAVSRDEGKALAAGKTLTDLINSNTNRLISIFPYNRLSVRKVSTSQLQILPVGPGRIRLRTNIMLPRATMESPEAQAMIEAHVGRSRIIVGEDVDMCRRLQKMAASRILEVGPLSPLEAPVWRFYQFIGGELARMKAALAQAA